MNIVGYADSLSVTEGDRIGFMVSSVPNEYRAEIVRIIHADANPDGPGIKTLPVASELEGQHPGILQPLRHGSFVTVPRPVVSPGRSFTVQMWLQPTLVTKSRQSILSSGSPSGDGFAVELLDAHLTLTLWADGRTVATVATEGAAELNTWYFLHATVDAESGSVSLGMTPLAATASELALAVTATIDPLAVPDGAVHTAVAATAPADDALTMIAARAGAGDDGHPGDFYNGKIDSPRVFDRALSTTELARLAAGIDPTLIAGLVAAWDFSRDIRSTQVTDVAGNGFDGVTVQRPTRGMTGHTWDGTEHSWPHAPEQWGSIHFHDDDLDDAGWQESLAWTVPSGLASGIYALHLTSGADEDYIWFVVRPTTPTAKAVFLMPTFSYLAYSNEHMMAGQEELWEGLLGRVLPYPVSTFDTFMVENRLNSLYDVHSDGSGVVYSSRLRPIVNQRPGYRSPTLPNGRDDEGSAHQFAADTHLIDWLTESGYDVDIVTDEDLYREGAELLKPYDVVLTGTHAEYWSGRMLESVQTYLEDGGRMMNLSGNGFYWVTELDPEAGHTIEIRRRPPSTRAWEPAAGEGNISFTGEIAGLWRYRNKAPNKMLGVGFTAEGFGRGRPFEREPDSFDPRAAFVFEGIGDDELIGDLPSLVCEYGAAGFEFDRLDRAIGTPVRTMLLASARDFSDSYQHASEEVGASTSLEGGTVNPLVRADMTLTEYPKGGAVWSASTIQWCACLSQNDYDNTVSTVTRNVLDRFLSAEPVFAPVEKA